MIMNTKTRIPDLMTRALIRVHTIAIMKIIVVHLLFLWNILLSCLTGPLKKNEPAKLKMTPNV